MVINWLNLKQFRNYTNLNIEFHPKLNIFFGNNGQGKTNLIESIYFLVNLRSFRGQKDQELCQSSTNWAELEAQFTLNQVKNQIKILLNNAGKTVFLNDKTVLKTSELVKKFGCLLFAADSVVGFKTSPKFRRRLLDRFNCLFSKNYLAEFIKTQQAIRHKNSLLKQKKKQKLGCGTNS